MSPRLKHYNPASCYNTALKVIFNLENNKLHNVLIKVLIIPELHGPFEQCGS